MTTHITFKDFLIEYSFKRALPKDVCKVYPIHFSDEEISLMNDIDGGWHTQPHKCGCDQLVSNFFLDKKYKMGSPNVPFQAVARRFRDRVRITIHLYDTNDQINDSSFQPIEKETFDIKFDNYTQLKRLLCQALQKFVD